MLSNFTFKYRKVKNNSLNFPCPTVLNYQLIKEKHITDLLMASYDMKFEHESHEIYVFKELGFMSNIKYHIFIYSIVF